MTTQPPTPTTTSTPTDADRDGGRDLETDPAPDDLPEEPPHACAYCGRPFTREEWLALHRGLAHADRLSDRERAAYERALESEEADLRMFRLQAIAVLIVIYFGFLIVYAFVA